MRSLGHEEHVKERDAAVAEVEEGIASSLICPITQDVMTIPRKLPEGDGRLNLVGMTRDGMTAALLEAVAQARTRLFDGADALLGVHYRGTDTASEFPYRKIPYAQVADRLDVALAKARVDWLKPPKTSASGLTFTTKPAVGWNQSCALILPCGKLA